MWIPKYLKMTNFISFKEQLFNFRNNEATLIQGRNLQDKSQAGNGAGKSSLIEAVAVAFSGTSVRDVLTKDLIHTDEKSSELEIFLENKVINKTLKIWRKIYANTKSAECRIWVNDKEKSDLPDINSCNKYIFEILGISKEDFFNFYLITDENGFVPFLKAPDSKKKEIINRFSGADKVDLAFPHIEQDAANKQREIEGVEKEIASLQSKQQLLVEQSVQEEEKLNPDRIGEQVLEKRNSIEILNSQIVDHELSILSFAKEKDTKTTELAQFQRTDFDTDLKANQAKKGELVEELAKLKHDLQNCKSAFQDDIDAIVKQESGLKEQKEAARVEIVGLEKALDEKKSSTRQSINEYKQFIDDVNNKLAGAITCPSCQHVFSLKDKEFNAEEAKAALPDAEKELAALQTTLESFAEEQKGIDKKRQEQKDRFAVKEKEIEEAKQEVNKLVLAKQEVVKADILKNSEATTIVDKAILDINNRKDEESRKIRAIEDVIRQNQLSIEREEASIRNLKTQIESLNRQIELALNVDRSKIEDLEAQVLELISKEEELQEKLQVLTEEKKNIDAWALHFKSFKSHLANQSLKNICDFTNLYLKEMGSNISIDIEGYRMMTTKKLKEEITTTVLKDGFAVGVYGKFSKGEKARIDICNVLANQELINLNSTTGGISLLLVDEVLDACDPMGIEAIVNACQGIGKDVMIVSQNETAVVGHTIVIQKENKVSTILN